jgi:prepilin-type N-terminal cleavage/methylation domain-containing protein
MKQFVFARLLPTRQNGDDGFTLTEVMVTLFVISAVLLGLITVQVRALASVGLAKERQQATALANRTMEQLRALPYDTVSAGLRLCDTTGDANIVGANFRPSYDAAINEPIVTNTTTCSGAALAPLYPHVQNNADTLIGSTQFRARTYVSRAGASGDQGYFLTVIVDWVSSNANNVPKLVGVRSRLYSPVGCTASSTATRPFAGPCQAFFYSDAGTSPAGITVSPVTQGDTLVAGTDVVGIEAKLPSLSTRTQNEQIVSAQSIATTSKIVLSEATDQIGGGDSGTSAADTDPASGTGNSPAAATSVSYSGGASMSAPGSTAAFGVAGPSSGSGSAYSTTTAAASPVCADDANTALTTNQACSSANLTPSGAYRATMDINLPGGSVASMDLARIATTGTAWRSFGARMALPASGHCTGTTGIGCVASGARRSLGAVTVGPLPAAGAGDTVPAGFTTMASLDGFTAQVGSESGITPGAGVATRAANTLRYWNGSAYVPVTLTNAGGSYTMGTATGTYRLAGIPRLVITMTGTVVVDPVTSVASGAAPCQTTACSRTSTVGAVRMSVQYDISDGVLPLGSFVVSVDLGNTLAQTTYKAAPSA